MNENKIISCILQSREGYERLLPYLDPYNFTEFIAGVYKQVAEYYDNDPAATECDRELILNKLVKGNPKREGLYREYFASLPAPASVENVVKFYEELAKDKIKEDLILALSTHQEDKAVELIEKLQTYKIEEEKEELYNAPSLESITTHFVRGNLIPIYPTPLNDALGGGVPRQTQVCIYARPDVGKTTVSINAAVGAAEAGFRVLYIGNEDPTPKMLYRVLTRFCRKPQGQITEEDVKGAVQKGYTNFFFKPMHPGNYKELRKVIEEVKPDVVVIDQIRNMNFDNESMTLNLERGVKATRALAKEFNLVMILITQAGNSAANKVVLDMEDVEWSNTGVAGQQDLMIGVGQNSDMKDRRIIMLSFPKNKLTAPIPPMQCNIEYEVNRLTVSQ